MCKISPIERNFIIKNIENRESDQIKKVMGILLRKIYFLKYEYERIGLIRRNLAKLIISDTLESEINIILTEKYRGRKFLGYDCISIKYTEIEKRKQFKMTNKTIWNILSKKITRIGLF